MKDSSAPTIVLLFVLCLGTFFLGSCIGENRERAKKSMWQRWFGRALPAEVMPRDEEDLNGWRPFRRTEVEDSDSCESCDSCEESEAVNAGE
jgi:hypothetical protein